MARSILITGASSGIGSAAAKALAGPGTRLCLTFATDEGGVRQTADACCEAGADVAIAQLDQRSPDGVQALIDKIRTGWGELHVLVNNGSICPRTPWEDISVAEWDAVMEVNARGPFLMIAKAVPLLRATPGDRSIVNISSIAGQIGGLTTSIHYAASKAAVHAITFSFARLLAPSGIRVNAVSPGPIETPMNARLQAEARRGLSQSVPLGRMGSPHEVASAIALLASEGSGFTTGAIYDVNGGLRMG